MAFFFVSTLDFLLLLEALAPAGAFLVFFLETGFWTLAIFGFGLTEAGGLAFGFPLEVRVVFLRVVFFLATAACLRVVKYPVLCGKSRCE